MCSSSIYLAVCWQFCPVDNFVGRALAKFVWRASAAVFDQPVMMLLIPALTSECYFGLTRRMAIDSLAATSGRPGFRMAPACDFA
jgi:hypothetical protein